MGTLVIRNLVSALDRLLRLLAVSLVWPMCVFVSLCVCAVGFFFARLSSSSVELGCVTSWAAQSRQG